MIHIILLMSYVKQICDGYSKRSLMGNWKEERLYPQQPFRQSARKISRPKDEQQGLPRIDRKQKWETVGRVVLNDGKPMPRSDMKANFPPFQIETASKKTNAPFDKNLSAIFGTENHPGSQVRVKTEEHRILNPSSAKYLLKTEQAELRPPKQRLKTHQDDYCSSYMQTIGSPKAESSKGDKKKPCPAGDFNLNPEHSVKMVSSKPKDSLIFPKTQSQAANKQDKSSGIKSKNDIQTSLNMGSGVHNIHPRQVPDGYFAKHGSAITSNPNKSPCRR